MQPLNRREAIALAASGITSMSLAAAASGAVFSVRESPPAGPAAADDAPAFEQAIELCLKAGGGVVYFPAGAYRLGKRIAVDLPPGSAIAFRGDGPALSKVAWTCDDGGLAIYFQPEGGFAGNAGAILVEGLTLLTTKPAGGSALRLECRGRTSPSPAKRVRDLVFAGASHDAGWTVGVECVECTFATLDCIDFQGAGQNAGVAVRFSGEHDPVDNYVSRLRVFGATAGIEVTGNCEGVYVTQSTMLAVERGVHWHTTRGEPLLALSGCHVAASRDCVFGHNLIQPIITGNLLYQSPQAAGGGEWAGVRLSADEPSIYDLLQVSHNTIHGFPSAGAKVPSGIVISGRTGGIVHGNIIQDVNVGVSLDEKSGDVRVLDNFVRAFADHEVLDLGKGNVIRRE